MSKHKHYDWQNETWIVYLAGFFDGEGTVAVYKNTGYQSVNSYFLYASVSQKQSAASEQILKFLLEEFGGSYYETVNKSGSFMWKWQINRDKAVPFLERIYPYLIVKKRQTRVALDWQAEKITLKPRPIPKNKRPEIKEYLRRTKAVAEYIKELKR